MNKILVWDWPVRIGHWLMVAGFALAWLTAESETFHVLHIISGGIVLGVATFRLLWGLIGTRYARFSNFVRSPKQVRAYLALVFKLEPPEHLGHNPAGAVAIVLLLGLGIATSLLGWAVEVEFGGHWLEEIHEAAASVMLGVVAVHLLGIAFDSFLNDQNLVRTMWDGRKEGEKHHGIRSARPVAAGLLIVWVIVVCWYLLR